jgi:hypothetical protein
MARLLDSAERGVRAFVILALAGTTLYVLWLIYSFGQGRFFTIDEYQWGHATWLVATGDVPYRDFYEHHFPLGYLLHSIFLTDEAGFVEKALLLRKIAFGYVLVASALVGAAAYVASRNVCIALLLTCMPLAFGFSLMSLIEYRGDNWAAFCLLSCLALLEMNRSLRRRSVAIVSGILFGCAIFMTQKTLVLGGGAVILMVVLRILDATRIWRDPFEPPLLYGAPAFCLAAATVALAVLGLGAYHGVLAQAWHICVVQAIEHAELYPPRSALWFIEPFLRETRYTTLAILVCTFLYFRRGLGGFWTLPLLITLLGSLSIEQAYPYNFVLLCLLMVICSVRGFCGVLQDIRPQRPVTRSLLPLLYLVPLGVLPSQLGFLDGTTSNDYQLRLLETIERHTDDDDVVIDDAGGALFRPHRSYYWYHGKAHVKMFQDYFTKDFVGDLRSTRAIFWIRGLRSRQLPARVERYLLSHYVQFDGSLYVLGFVTEPTAADESRSRRVDIIREGEYHVSLDPGKDEGKALGRMMPWTEDLLLNGEPITGETVRLERRSYTIRTGASSPGYRFSLLPPSSFGELGESRDHAPLFEYRKSLRGGATTPSQNVPAPD